MPLEQLLRSLATETEDAARRLLDEARASARALVDAAETAAGRQAAGAQEQEEAAQREALERDLAACRREGRLHWLRARAELLDRIFALAHARLPEIAAGADYGASIPAELDLALPFLEDTACVVHCPPAHAAVARRHLAGRPEIRVEADLPDGLRIVACDGSVEVDRTLSRRVDSLRVPLSVNLLQELYAECDQSGTT